MILRLNPAAWTVPENCEHNLSSHYILRCDIKTWEVKKKKTQHTQSDFCTHWPLMHLPSQIHIKHMPPLLTYAAQETCINMHIHAYMRGKCVIPLTDYFHAKGCFRKKQSSCRGLSTFPYSVLTISVPILLFLLPSHSSQSLGQS